MDDRPNLYDDIVTWAEEQAPALRALAARSDPSNAVGWDDVIETSGRSEIHGIESLLLQTPGHVLEYASAPAAQSPRSWRAEVLAFQSAARRNYGGRHVGGLPETSPFAPEELLAAAFERGVALERLAAVLKFTPARH